MNSGTIAGLTSAPLKTKGWNNLQKTVTSSGTVSWKSGLGAVTQILGPADTIFKISTPNTSTPSDTTKALTISTGNSLVGTDPQAHAGDLTVQAGGGGNGGALKLYGGSGPYNGGRGSGQAWGGHITLNGNSGWAAGSVFINGGQGGSYNSSGGNITLTSGTVQYPSSAPGNISLIASPSSGGLTNGGSISNTTGLGSINSTANAISYAGGNYTVVTGGGGAGTATTGTTTGGIGGSFSITTGAGGAATSVTTSTRTGGNSGTITLSTGQGGDGTTVNGSSGSIIISTGLPGAVGTGGVSGSILLNTGSTNQITISPARTTITNEAKIERAAVIEASSTSIQLDVTNYAGMIINCISSSAVTITLPTTNVPLGYNVVVIRSGTGTVTFVEGTVAVGGAVNIIKSYNSLKSIDGVNSTASLICLKSGSSGVSAEYNLSGSLIA